MALNEPDLCSPFSVVPMGRLSLRSPRLLLTVLGQVVGTRGNVLGQFGVSIARVSQIKRKKAWAHLPAEESSNA